MKKLKYSIIGAFLLGSTLAAYAQAPDLDLAHKVVKAVHATDQFDMFLPQAVAVVKRRLLADYPKDAKIISSVVDDEAMKLVKRRAELDDAAAKVYAKHFTTDELKSIEAFYDGSVGSKLLKTAPQTMGDLVKAFQGWSDSVGKALESNSRAAVKAKLGDKK